MRVPPDDYRWLVSEAAKPWLALAAGESASVQLIQRLRKDLSAERAALVAEQADLRRRARHKFALAAEMFFTAQGFEQATDEWLATYKASRFAAGALVADLCCGIGGDLLALGKRGPVVGFDADPAVAILAQANLCIAGVARDTSKVIAADAASQDAQDLTAWHCDPDRRSSGSRTTTLEFFSPPLEVLTTLLSRNANAAIKLASATIAPAAWAAQAELEWLSSHGECRQQVAWFGSLAQFPGQRAATIVGPHEARTVVGQASDEWPIAESIGRYVFEPDAAVLAARLTAALCAKLGLAGISSAAAYLTGDEMIHDSALDAFEVRDVLPLDRKQLKAYCRAHGIGQLAVKKRGVDIDPNRLVRELAADGDEEAVILLAPVNGKVLAIVAKRVV